MTAVLPYLVFALGFAVVLGGMWWFASLAKRRGIGSPMMNTIDELFHPAAHQSQLEHRVEEERMVPRTSEDD
ncbi:hypothetical protein [Actinophytocola sp.]|uniref:hypothetical protein n=1 Tax=Actinophytocola sp. TaxID=1872138 RepID=UPI003D6B373F